MHRWVTLAAVVVLAAAAAASGQEAAKRPGGALGDLASIDAASGLLKIKTAAGAEATASISPTTEFLLVDAGAKSLEGAERITLSDVKVGDRVWARGEPGADGTIAARQLVVMSAQSIAERNRQDARDWQTRGLIGEVVEVDPAAKALTVQTYRGDRIAVDVGTSALLRRLNPGATDLSNSASISFEEIAVGNQIAVRGDRTPDGARLAAETVLTGTFPRPVRGRVAAVDAAKGEVSIATPDGATVALEVPSGALVRKLVPRMPGGPDGQRGPRRPGGPEGAQSGDARPAPAGGAPGEARAGRPGGPEGGPRRGPGGFAFALGDRGELERRTSEIPLSEVAAGDFVFAVVEPGATATTARARVLVKFELPPDRTPRGPGMQGPPSPSMDVDDDLPF